MSAPLSSDTLLARLLALADPEIAAHALRFFKTGPGEYGEGDRFLGLRVPTVRALAREARGIAPEDVLPLLTSEWHEARLLALVILVEAYGRADPAGREAIAQLYLAHTTHVNNWDLVDTSAPAIVGAHVDATGDPGSSPGQALALLDRLAASDSLWERRIAIVSTFHFIRRGEYAPTLLMAETLRDDPHDLIHKAVGWMLREVGKRDREVAEGFLRRHAAQMPRTMLRYAIERFPEPLRQQYLRA